MKLPSYVKKYFWEVDVEKLDCKKNPEYVASRILEYGDIKTSRWLLRNIGREIIKDVLFKRRGISLRGRTFWVLFFNFSKECLKKFYQKKQKNFWPY